MNILLCPHSSGGYLYPALAAGRRLQQRGHRVSVLGHAAAGPVVAEAGLPFAAAEDFGGRRAFSPTWWGTTGLEQYQVVTRAARQSGADLLVTSVLCNGPLAAAEALDIPVVVIGFSVHLWDYRSGGAGEPQWGRPRGNRTAEMLRWYADTREQAGLAARPSRWAGSPLPGDALLLRGDPLLEHPGAVLPARVHQVGPLAWEPAADPAEVEAVRAHLARTGKPVVYVHLGRFFGGKNPWPRLNALFTGGRFQAVVEQGRSSDPRPAPGADILLVRKPWMGPLIDSAGLVLTSGTSAPVLAALLRRRPLAVSPNGSEQPLLSGACLRAGVAAYLPNRDLPDAADPADVLAAAWQDEGLRERARALGSRLAAGDSAGRAADVIEQVARQSPATRETMGMHKADHAPVGQLAEGALEWIRVHAGYLDSPAGRAELPVTPRVKALLQLALLCRYWAKAAPAHPGLREVRATVESAWRSPAYAGLLTADPDYARPIQLTYAALAPADGNLRRAVLQRIAAEGYLTPRRKTPYHQLSTRFFADLAGAAHHLDSYQALYQASQLARYLSGQQADDPDPCVAAHTAFYLTDFGFRESLLGEDAREHARAVLHRFIEQSVQQGEWDLAGKLVLAQHCLGGDPVRTDAAALRMLAGAQTADGAIPGRTAAGRATAGGTAFFRAAYQTTLVTAMTALIISHRRPDDTGPAGRTPEPWGAAR